MEYCNITTIVWYLLVILWLVKSEKLQRKVPIILSLFINGKFITEFLEK